MDPGQYLSRLSSLACSVSSAEENEIALLDFYHPFCDKTGNAIGIYFLEDGLHPNAAGHSLMASITVDMLKERYHFT